MVVSRLSKRLRYYSLNTFTEYFNLMIASSKDGERQVVVDLLTTNETYFFREFKHFSFLEKSVLANWIGGKTFRVWSAASSTGEEAYSISMLLDDILGGHPWEVVGSDISRRVIEIAKRGHYRQDRIDGIPMKYLQKYCLKGVDEQKGTLLIDASLRQKVLFIPMNLKNVTMDIGFFDVVFLRNVLIYFDFETQKNIIRQVVEKMVLGGYLFIGHSESIKGLHKHLEPVLPTVYRKISSDDKK